MTEGTAQDNFYAIEYSEFYNNIKNLTSELKSMKSLCTERHKIDINSEIMLLKFSISELRKNFDKLESDNRERIEAINRINSQIVELLRTN